MMQYNLLLQALLMMQQYASSSSTSKSSESNFKSDQNETILSSEVVPVLTWGRKLASKPALVTLNGSDFVRELRPWNKSNHMIIAFVERRLNKRDFFCGTKSTEDRCWPFLSTRPHRTFYESVESPVTALKLNYSSFVNKSRLMMDTNNTEHILCRKGTVNIFEFDDTSINNTTNHSNNISQEDIFKRHDLKISNVTKQLKECPVLYVYTSYRDRVKSSMKYHTLFPRHLNTNASSDIKTEGNVSYCIILEGVVFKWANILYRNTSFRPYSLIFEECYFTPAGSSFLITLENPKYDNNLAILIHNDSGYYVVQAYYFVYAHRITGVSVPNGKSYACDQVDGFFNSENNEVISLTFLDLQFEIFDHNISLPISFSEVWHCRGAMSIGAIICIGVVFILIGIQLFGVIWFFEIGRNDRMNTKSLPGLVVTS